MMEQTDTQGGADCDGGNICLERGTGARRTVTTWTEGDGEREGVCDSCETTHCVGGMVGVMAVGRRDGVGGW